MSIEQEARKQYLARIRAAKAEAPSTLYDNIFSLPGTNDTSKRAYEKPTKTQREGYISRHAIELMEEEKLLKQQTGDVWE